MEDISAKLRFTEDKLKKISELLDSGLLSAITYVRDNMASRATPDELNRLKNIYTEVSQQKLQILSPLEIPTATPPGTSDSQKKSNSQPPENIYYKKTWSIWDKVYFIIVQSDGAKLNVGDLFDKIVEYDGLGDDPEAARRTSVNLNATLSAKFRNGNDIIDRVKEKGEYRYFLKVTDDKTD